MKDVKEFHGKTLDEAIKSACQFYKVEREKLEIEIVNDSKMGIFGLVNVKKACVRASLANTDSILEGLAETLTQSEPQTPKGKRGQGAKSEKSEKPEKNEKSKGAKPAPKAASKATGNGGAKATSDSPVADTASAQGQTSKDAPKSADAAGDKKAEAKGEASDREEGRAARSQSASSQSTKGGRPVSEAKASGDDSDSSAPAKTRGRKAAGDESGEEEKEKSGRSQKRERSGPRQESRPRRGRGAERKPSDAENGVESDENGSGEGFSLADLETFDQDELQGIIHDVVNRLVSSIIGEVPLTITIDEGHIRVKVDCEEDARILVGREGQTLASVQYIASRILAGKLQGAVRLHIDTGNYKENQDARLTGLALMLAEKLRKSGRTQSTRPLSAYQRRIVHLALEGEDDIQTSSKGDGPQRRVLIHFKRNRNQRNAPQVEEDLAGCENPELPVEQLSEQDVCETPDSQGSCGSPVESPVAKDLNEADEQA